MRLFREPLLHFFILGALVFAVYSWFDEGEPRAETNRIEITQELEAGLARQFEQTWRRVPTGEELAGLIDRYIDEEVLVREAIVLGLDRGDAVVRQRLALKMQFLLEAGAGALEPDDAELNDFLAANAGKYQSPPRLTFEQVLLATPTEEAPVILAALNAGDSPEAWGAPTLLPASLSGATPREVDAVFGDGFFGLVAELEPTEWAGPLQSGFGLHLVRVQSYAPGRSPLLDEVRNAVTGDWIAEKTQELSQQRLEALRSRYDIVTGGRGESD